MKYIIPIIAILVGCSTERVVDTNSAHDQIIQSDLSNKQRELDILREIHAAQVNQDEEAFKFFLGEYMRVPRLELNDEQKQHPDFREWLDDYTIKSGKFIDSRYDYLP